MHGMILHGKISTTEAKAKSIKGDLEKLVTLAKTRGEEAERLILSRLSNERATARLLSEIAPKFATRAGGYTKILRMGPRVKDGAKMVLMTWSEQISAIVTKEPKRKDLKPKTESSKKTATSKEKKPAKTSSKK